MMMLIVVGIMLVIAFHLVGCLFEICRKQKVTRRTLERANTLAHESISKRHRLPFVNERTRAFVGNVDLPHDTIAMEPKSRATSTTFNTTKLLRELVCLAHQRPATLSITIMLAMLVCVVTDDAVVCSVCAARWCLLILLLI